MAHRGMLPESTAGYGGTVARSMSTVQQCPPRGPVVVGAAPPAPRRTRGDRAFGRSSLDEVRRAVGAPRGGFCSLSLPSLSATVRRPRARRVRSPDGFRPTGRGAENVASTRGAFTQYTASWRTLKSFHGVEALS